MNKQNNKIIYETQILNGDETIQYQVFLIKNY